MSYRIIPVLGGTFRVEIAGGDSTTFSREFASHREAEGWIAAQEGIDRRADAFMERSGRPQPRHDDN